MDLKQTKLNQWECNVKLVNEGSEEVEGLMQRKELGLTDSRGKEPEAQWRKVKMILKILQYKDLVTTASNKELSKSMLGSELQGEDFAKRMVDLVNQRKKLFAEERAKAKRNKPMTQSQLKTYNYNLLEEIKRQEVKSAEEIKF
ncbi:hypothetical protein Tco_0598555 [Tanacetum coccineum]